MRGAEKTREDLARRGYSDDEALSIVNRAIAICADEERNWNCAGDLLVGRITWGAAMEIALEEHIIDGFKSGRYVVPRDW